MVDLSNQVFGRLIAVWHKSKNKWGNYLWFCYCCPELGGCGHTCMVANKYLRSGKTQSCGCYHIDTLFRTYPHKQLAEMVRLRRLDFTYAVIGRMLELPPTTIFYALKSHCPELAGPQKPKKRGPYAKTRAKMEMNDESE